MEAGVSEGMTTSLQPLKPPGRNVSKQNKNKNNPFREHVCVLEFQSQRGGATASNKRWLFMLAKDKDTEQSHILQILTRKEGQKAGGRISKSKREPRLWEKIRAGSLGNDNRWSSWISCLSLCDSGCCGRFVCSNSTIGYSRERNLCFPQDSAPKTLGSGMLCAGIRAGDKLWC